MKYKQAVLRKTLSGDWEEFSFTNLSRHFKVKNLSDSDILVSFEKDDVDEDQCFKIASGYIETVQISDKVAIKNQFVANNNEDIFSSNVIYVKGTGDVEVCALEGFELITANQVAITVTAENCTYSGDTTLMQGGMATITFVNAEGYNLPETITVTGAGHNWNQATGIATLFNLSSASSVTVSCVCEQDQPAGGLTPFEVGQSIVSVEVDTTAVPTGYASWDAYVSYLETQYGDGVDKALVVADEYDGTNLFTLQGSASFGFMIQTSDLADYDGLIWVSKGLEVDHTTFPARGWYTVVDRTPTAISGTQTIAFDETYTISTNGIDTEFAPLNGVVLGAVLAQ